MQIKIEIDVKPEELRRFLGLPDVAGLQDDVVRFLREKVSAAGDTFDPAAVLQGSLDLIRRNPTWKLLRGAMGRDRDDADDVDADVLLEPETPAPKKSRRTRTSATAEKKTGAKKSRRAKPAVTTPQS